MYVIANIIGSVTIGVRSERVQTVEWGASQLQSFAARSPHRSPRAESLSRTLPRGDIAHAILSYDSVINSLCFDSYLV